MDCVGLIQWANSIRHSMVNDPGRQMFQDQMQTHGFVFLDDYLDNILLGATQDPLIELVKTPGRRKFLEKKLQLTSKLSKVMIHSSEDQGSRNESPIIDFHQTLMEVKNTKSKYAVQPSRPLSSQDDPFNQGSVETKCPASLIFAPVMSQNIVTLHQSAPAPLLPPISPPPNDGPHLESGTVSVHAGTNELSVIVEDDENMERSRTSVQLKHSPSRHSFFRETPVAFSQVEAQDNSNSPKARHSSNAIERSLSSEIFQEITLDPQGKKNSVSPHREFTQGKSNLTVLNHTEPLPNNAEMQVDKKVDYCNTEPLPKVSNCSVGASKPDIVHTPRDSENDSKPMGYSVGMASIPALPNSMPIKIHTQASRDPSMGNVLIGASTPGAAMTGKRTSWLSKMREANKALDVGIRRTPMPLPAPLVNSQLKRKSEILDSGLYGSENLLRQSKASKEFAGEVAPLKSQSSHPSNGKAVYDHRMEARTSVQEPIAVVMTNEPLNNSEGVLDRLKKTVEGIGARIGMGKSMGGTAAVTALAEARAAAEARVAERYQREEEKTMAMDKPNTTSAGQQDNSSTLNRSPKHSTVQDSQTRLSISELFPSEGRVKEKHKAPEKIFQAVQTSEKTTGPSNAVDPKSASTMQPNSLLAMQWNSFVLPPEPVFNKPPPVFTAPILAAKPPKVIKSVFSHFQSATVSVPTMTLEISPRVKVNSNAPAKAVTLAPLHFTMTTVEKGNSETTVDLEDEAPDIVYLNTFDERSAPSEAQGVDVLDEDDSWPVDEKLAEGVHWTFGMGTSKEDSMTWSTLPTQSQRGDTDNSFKHGNSPPQLDKEGPVQSSRSIPGAFDSEMDEIDEEQGDDDVIVRDSELEEMALSGKVTVNLVEKITRSRSQMSMTSSASSQSQAGFFSQASKMLNAGLGVSKKGKPEVKKVLKMAAVAAKRQQEETDKKATRLKEMENRRQQAMQRKTEEEKIKAQEQERKMKDENERRKREREELTDKRPLKPTTANKKEEDAAKKRKMESEKKPELKKVQSSSSIKPSIKSALKQQTALSSSAAYNTSFQNGKNFEMKIAPSSIQKGHTKVAVAHTPVEDDISQPSQIVQTQMAARAKAQLQAAKQIPSLAPTETIELPDINSEYSDSEDEDRPKAFNPPDWAQSPELRNALTSQSTINPDDIFGAIKPLRMEDVFRTRTSRFRARTSSANWTGTDRLTLEEEREYARRMGFK